MAQASASSASTTAINAPGGGITKNSPGIWIAAIVAVVLLVWILKRK